MILEEGDLPHPRCPQCDVFVSHNSLNDRNLTTAFFRRGMERKQHRLAEEEAWAGAEAEVTANDIPLYPVTSFRYLGRVLLAANDNWPLVVSNLWKS